MSKEKKIKFNDQLFEEMVLCCIGKFNNMVFHTMKKEEKL